MVIIRFTEIGSPAILHERADLLYNRTLALDDLLPRHQIDNLQDILAGTPEISRQILPVERFLSSRIRARNPISAQIEAAAALIRNSHGRASIRAIAPHLALTLCALTRHFPAHIRATPQTP